MEGRLNIHDRDFRIVPSNIEAEQALLGAILMNNAAFDRVSAFLEPEHFFEKLHQRMFAVVSEMLRQGKSVTPILLKSYFAGEKIDDNTTVTQYLMRLAAGAVTVINAKDYGQAIHEMWIRRQAISVTDEVSSIAYDLPPDRDVLDELAPVEEKLAALRAERIRGAPRAGIGTRYIENMTAAHQRGEIQGVPICLGEIADVISEPCFEAGNLYGLLSSSGEGKTALTVQIIVYALRKGHPVLFLSYDQSSDQIVRQMIAQEYGIEARRQRDPKLLSEREWETCLDFARWIEEVPIEIVRCTNHGAAQLVGFARTFVKRFGNGRKPLVVVDHIGSVSPEDKRADEGTKAKHINQIFKAGAETTDSAWLVLNQRNSYGMKRDNPRPISADLFGGDPAKQAYDAIFYLYRFLKFYEERKAIASTDQDWKKINKVFPSAVRDDGIDVAELGAVKVRFGSPHIRRDLTFEARLTRYKSERRKDQPELIEGGL